MKKMILSENMHDFHCKFSQQKLAEMTEFPICAKLKVKRIIIEN